MNLRIRTSCLLWGMLVGAVFVGCSRSVHETSKDTQVASREVEPFSIMNSEHVGDLQKKMEIARGQCTNILNRSARANESELDRPILPAILLGKLRAYDDESLNALVSHLSLRSRIGKSPHALNTYVAAQAIVEIGGPKARAAILRKMEQELNREQLMLCAHILSRLDERDVILSRLEKARAESSDDTLRYNIERVFEAMSKEDFAVNRQYWPSGPANNGIPTY